MANLTSLLSQAIPTVDAAVQSTPVTTGQYAIWGAISTLIVFPLLAFGERQYQKLQQAHEAERQRIDAAHQAERLRVDAAHQQEKQTLMTLVENTNADNRKMHERLGGIEKTLKDQENNVTTLTQKVTTLETHNVALVAENTSLKKLCRQQQQRINDLSNEVTLARNDLANEHATRVAAQEETGRLKLEVNTLVVKGTPAGQPERYPTSATNQPHG